MSEKQPEELQVSPENILEFLCQGGAVRDLKGYDDNTMEGIYHVAYVKYQSGLLSDAEKIFSLLCLLNHYEKKYHFGLAACRHRMNKYQQAVDSYSVAGILDVNNPEIPFLAAQCHMALGDFKAAKSGFTSALEGAKNYADIELRQKAEKMLAMVSRQQNSNTTGERA